MNEEIDFSVIAEKLKVKESVIDHLSTILPFKDSFDFLVSVDSNEFFWNLIDLLPRHHAMHLHSLDIEIPTTSKDFPKEFISPTIQTFWASNCISQGKSPTTINSRSITRIYSSGLRYLLQEDENWSIEEDSQRAIWEKDKSFNFDISLLGNVCNSFISNGLSWLFLELSDLRLTYNKIYQHLSSIEDRNLFYRVIQIENKLKTLSFNSTEEIREALGDLNPEFEITEFQVPPELLDDIRALMQHSKECTMEQNIDMQRQSLSESNSDESEANAQKKNLGFCPPSLPAIDEWTRTRTEALVTQMSYPLQQRSAFQMTPSIFSARMGQVYNNSSDGKNNSPFEPLSLSELLFSDSSGNVAPMPYSSCKVELPSQSYTLFCKSALKRFIARKMIKNGYESTSDACLDILVDMLTNELKKIAQNSSRISKCVNKDEVDDKDILLRALELGGYDVVSLQNC